MKRILIYITIVLASILAGGCKESYVTYSDAEYVMFADTLNTYPVQDESLVYGYDNEGNPVYGSSTFSIPVVSTVKRDYDRTFAVEVIDKGSNAVEKRHYRIESNTVTIKAGETRADVLVHGDYDSLEPEDSLGFELRLVMDERLIMPLYGSSTKAVLMKSCPFDINDFTGWCVLTSMFLYDYSTTGSYQRLIQTEVHPGKPNTIICRNWINDGYDVTMTFLTDDPTEPFVIMDEDQVASDEGSFFGITHGDDRILVTHSPLAESVYYPCGKYLYLWAQMYVEDLGVTVGTVGHYYNIMEWVSDEEAERLQRVEGM